MGLVPSNTVVVDQDHYLIGLFSADHLRDTRIKSCQNGQLMLSNVHNKFDNFSFAINPDDNYGTVAFGSDPFNYAFTWEGSCLWRSNRSMSAVPQMNSYGGVFHEAVLANMRGSGEPVFESDFPPGTDMVGEIFRGPAGSFEADGGGTSP